MLLTGKIFQSKKLLIFFLLFLLLSSCKSKKNESDIEGDEIVFVCSGRLSKAYHIYGDCYGLKRCSGEIREITKDEAKRMNRHFCTFCKTR